MQPQTILRNGQDRSLLFAYKSVSPIVPERMVTILAGPLYRHAHPLMILTNLSRVLYLLIIPFVRGALLALWGRGLAAWLKGAWFDILIVMLIIGIAAVRWRLFTYRFDESGLYFKKGLLLRQEGFLPFYAVCTMASERSWLLAPLRAAVLRADTSGGNPSRYDFEIITYRRDAAEALYMRSLACSARACKDLKPPPPESVKAVPSPEADKPPSGSTKPSKTELPRKTTRVFRPRSMYVAALSAFLSNSFAGVLLASAFLNRAGTVLGQKLEGSVLSAVSQISAWLPLGIPPVATAAGLIILAGWFIGFVRNMLSLIRFRIERSPHTLEVNVGLVTRRTYSILISKINFLDIRQSLMTKLLRLYMVFIQAIGYGKGKNEVAALIPSASRKELAATMTLLLPEIRPHARTVKPDKRAWLAYLFQSLLLVPALLAAIWLGWRLFPAWRDVVRFFGLALWVPLLWYFFLKLTDFFTAGLCFDGATYTLRYSKGFILHTVVVPVNRAAMVITGQNVFQKRIGLCDVIVYTYSESGRVAHRTHRVKGLPLREVLRELKLPQ